MSASLLASNELAIGVESLGWTLLHFLWQGALAWLAFKFFLGLARNASPQVRYLAGCATLALMCVAAGSTLLQQVGAAQQLVHESLAVRTDPDHLTVAGADRSSPIAVRVTAAIGDERTAPATVR